MLTKHLGTLHNLQQSLLIPSFAILIKRRNTSFFPASPSLTSFTRRLILNQRETPKPFYSDSKTSVYLNLSPTGAFPSPCIIHYDPPIIKRGQGRCNAIRRVGDLFVQLSAVCVRGSLPEIGLDRHRVGN